MARLVERSHPVDMPELRNHVGVSVGGGRVAGVHQVDRHGVLSQRVLSPQDLVSHDAIVAGRFPVQGDGAVSVRLCSQSRGSG